MPVTPLLGPAPIRAGESILDPKPDRSFASVPIYDHEREWIPKITTGRNLVLCFDGTGGSFNEDNSNVVQFLAMLRKDDPEKQLVYYQAGIGTYSVSAVKIPFIATVSRILDYMFASSLPDHVKEGYLFLMQNYRAGDKICIFGFSRGAYTARVLAGILQRVGLLSRSNLEQLPFAYAMYKKADKDGDSLCKGFKRTFSIDVKINFLGVWDTVGSVGLLPRHLPFTGSNNAILHFRHALALDERRVKYIPYYWTIDPNETAEPVTDVKEVFFAGVHCDVGGGSVGSHEPHSLARIPLRWMIRECFDRQIGIIFDEHMLRDEVGLDIKTLPKAFESSALDHTVPDSPSPLSTPPNPLLSQTRHLDRPDYTARSNSPPKTANTFEQLGQKPVAGSTTNEEVDEESEDAHSPIYDQFKGGLVWRIVWRSVDWLPWIIKKPDAEPEGKDGPRSYEWIWNRGRGRIVHHWVMDRGMKVHNSVRSRMEDETYRPKIRCQIDDKVWRPKRNEWLQEEFFKWVD